MKIIYSAYKAVALFSSVIAGHNCYPANNNAIDEMMMGLRLYAQPNNPQVGEDTLSIQGVIKEQFYVSKKNITTSQKEYFFEPDQQAIAEFKLADKYFIKLKESNVKADILSEWAGKKVQVKVISKKGLWDADENHHASRAGHYIALLAVEGL